jgi:RNA ligase (TIGR02306 family)
MRELVSYETIKSIRPIPDADAIELATVRGWDVVVKKGEFKVGDSVVYFEIDSFLPADDPRFEFLLSRGTRLMNGKQGHVLRTIRLRGQFSQGLILPAEMFPTLPEIEKWEPPLPQGEHIEGGFPLKWAPKTDSERIQNLEKFIPEFSKASWIATEKIDGTSTTFAHTDNGLVVASRNWAVGDSDFRYRILNDLELLDSLPEGWAVQGEVFGENIQNNPLQLKGQFFKAFSLYDNGHLVPYHEWPEGLVEHRVPLLPLVMPTTLEGFISQADKLKSTINPQKQAEGIVWHSDRVFPFLGNRSTFKAINNSWLLKHE